MTPMSAATMPSGAESEPDAGDEAEGQEAPEEETAAGAAGYMIAIKVKPDGTFAVCRKPMEAEPEERQGEGQAPYEEVPVQSFPDALKVAVKMHQENPSGTDERSHFLAAYGHAAPSGAPSGY